MVPHFFCAKKMTTFQDFLKRVETHVELKIVYLTVLASAGLLVIWMGLMLWAAPREEVALVLFQAAAILGQVISTLVLIKFRR